MSKARPQHRPGPLSSGDLPTRGRCLSPRSVPRAHAPPRIRPDGPTAFDDATARPPPTVFRTNSGVVMIMAQVQTEPKPIVNRTQALVWLRQMMLIRRFEERAEMLYQKGNKIGGFFHQYSGQEPVAVGSIGVLREDDYVITAYRDHGHALARGMDAKAAMAELLGKVTGCSKGQGRLDALLRRGEGVPRRPCHRRQPHPPGRRRRLRHQVPQRGPGLHLLLRRRRHQPGGVHEALNMAALWKLPVIYVVENNHVRDGDLAPAVLGRARPDRPRARSPTASPGFSINGNDIELMAKTTREAANRAPGRRGPDLHRRPDLPLQGPLDQRPGQVPPQGRARGGRQQRPDRRLSEHPQGARLDRPGDHRSHAGGRQGRRSRRASSSPSRASRRRWTPSTKTSRWPPLSHRSESWRC